MKQSADEKHFLNLAGEYGTCSELMKNKIYASITYGNHKAADIIAVNPNTKKTALIEVKTTTTNRFVTGFFQKYKTPEREHPDFWVLVNLKNQNGNDYFVLTHKEMADAQMSRNGMSEWGEFKGVDNVLIGNLEGHKDKWDKIADHLKVE